MFKLHTQLCTNLHGLFVPSSSHIEGFRPGCIVVQGVEGLRSVGCSYEVDDLVVAVVPQVNLAELQVLQDL